MGLSYQVAPGGRLRGTIRVPGDKSISHRALLFGALAEGETGIRGFLASSDTAATRQALAAMGVRYSDTGERLCVHGVGTRGLRPPADVLDLGNSGTSMRLLAGLLAGQGFACTLSGDESLCRRPMHRITEPLQLMGGAVTASSEGTAPLRIEPAGELTAIRYTLPVASAQIKSCLLLAGIYATGETCVTEPVATRDHSERLLEAFGYPLRRDGNTVCVQGGGVLRGCEIDVPADISSAAFFLVGAAISEGSDVTLQQVSVNPTRAGCVEILNRMGARIEVLNERELSGEPVADVRVRGGGLRGIDIPQQMVAAAIDEFPALFIAAACAEGVTRLGGASELRHKESDRISAMAQGLTRLGINAETTEDGIVIEGGKLTGGQVDSLGDHRLSMAFAMAALGAGDMIEIDNCANVATSFPNFAGLAQEAGLGIQEVVR
jgi:3-phosphoshikimate 1-carboxyvinyltransferase